MSSHTNDIEADKKQRLIEEIQPLLENTTYAIKQEIGQIKGSDHLGDGQIFLLLLLHRNGTLNASDIAHHIGITSGAVTGMTDKLFCLGMIMRKRSEEDRRVVLFSITDKGKLALKNIRDARTERLNVILQKLNEEDLEKMKDVFTKLNTVMN